MHFTAIDNSQCNPNGQHIGYCTVYCVLHLLFSTKAFLIKLFEKQLEDFFNVTSDSLLQKNSAIQLKSIKGIK